MVDNKMLTSPVYFISDLHFGVGTADVERIKRRRFVTLTETILQQRGSLVIVGDLFDFWYEYRSVVPRGSHVVLSALAKLTDAGCQTVYIAGNHDFAIGKVFSVDLNVTVISNDFHFTCEGKHFYAFHGDGLAANDRGYRLLKKILRARWAQTAFRLLHPDIAFALARRVSHGSRAYTAEKFYGATDSMRIEATARIEAGADFVIMGHRHLPLYENLGGGVYVNLGDWIRHFSYAVFENGVLGLRTISDNTSDILMAIS